MAAVWLRQALYVNDSTCWLNASRKAVQASVADILGNQLLAKGNPSFAELRRALPPMVMSSPTSIHDDPPHGTTHTFVGSRSSVTNMAFDVHGADINHMGYPSMGTTVNKYHRSAAVFKDPLDEQGQQEGLWGGYLPITSNYFRLASKAPPPAPAGPPAQPCKKPCVHNPRACCECTGGNTTCPGQPISTSPCCKLGDKTCCKRPGASVGARADPAPAAGGSALWTQDEMSGGYIEMTVVPVADMEGNMEQAGWFRFQKTAANGTVVAQKFYDTFAYTAGICLGNNALTLCPSESLCDSELSDAQVPSNLRCKSPLVANQRAPPLHRAFTQRSSSSRAGGQQSCSERV